MDPTTIAMVAIGAIIGVLAMSNYRLRQEVASLRQQVAALVKVVTDIRGEAFDDSDRRTVGRLRRENGLDPATGWGGNRAGSPDWSAGGVGHPDYRGLSSSQGRARHPMGEWDERDPAA